MNQVALVGRLTRDIEINKTGTGKSVTNFTLAVKDRFNKDKAHFIDCVAWEKQAELLQQYMKKGSQLGVEGNLIQRQYQTKEGQNRNVIEVNVSNVTFLDSPISQTVEHKQMQQPATKNNTHSQQSNNEPVLDITSDDLPF